MGQEIIRLTGTALVPLDVVEVQSELPYFAEIQKLEAEAKALEDAAVECSRIAAETIREFDSRPSIKLRQKELDNAMARINELKSRLAKRQKKKDDADKAEDFADDLEDDDDETITVDGNDVEEEVLDREAAMREHEENVTKMYRRIAMVCHPDKTKDPALHALFLEAKLAFESFQWSKVESLWATVENFKTMTRKQRRKWSKDRIEIARRRRDEAQFKLAQTRGDLGYQLYCISQTDDAKAEATYLVTLDKAVGQLYLQIASLRLALREYEIELAPMPSFFASL